MSSLLVIFVWGGVKILWVLSVKLLQNMVYNTTQHPPTFTHCLYILYDYFGKGGGRKEGTVEGQLYTRGVENTNMTNCISSL
jgi:hypothetical protein